MKCPYCGCDESKVVDSRPTDEGERIRRRRECARCARRFTTYEVIETTPLMVVKKDDTREPFDRDKLLRGLVRACEKRPVALARLEQLVDETEQRLQNAMEREISSRQLGEMALEQLKTIDEVAYVRFASVYRQFSDVDSFMAELEKLKRSRQGQDL